MTVRSSYTARYSLDRRPASVRSVRVPRAASARPGPQPSRPPASGRFKPLRTEADGSDRSCDSDQRNKTIPHKRMNCRSNMVRSPPVTLTPSPSGEQKVAVRTRKERRAPPRRIGASAASARSFARVDQAPDDADDQAAPRGAPVGDAADEARGAQGQNHRHISATFWRVHVVLRGPARTWPRIQTYPNSPKTTPRHPRRNPPPEFKYCAVFDSAAIKPHHQRKTPASVPPVRFQSSAPGPTATSC